MTFHLTRQATLLVAFLFGAIASTGSSSVLGQEKTAPRTLREFRGKTMGTTYMVKVAGAEGLDDQTLRFAIDGELRRVNDQMSTYLKSSEITRFNQSAGTDWFDVSAEFAGVVEVAQDIAEKTNGAFDITVGPLVDAWSFGTTERTRTVPDADTIERLLQVVGYEKLEVRQSPPALRKSVPELQIDLSSIAKGHGVDRVIAMLSQQGADDVFVEIGGEVRTSGDKPGGPWRVGIQLPDAVKDKVMIAHAMLVNEAAGNAMATSGDYRNNFTANGKLYSHTIDPRSGSPVDHNLASVTVVAQTCMEADGWATALNVLGKDAGYPVAEQNDLHTLLVTRRDAEHFEKFGTGVLTQYAQVEPTATKATNWLSAIIPIAILTFGVFSILLFAMAIGVVFGRKSISGSCGGLANMNQEDGSTSCALCSNPSDACQELRDKMDESKPTS